MKLQHLFMTRYALRSDTDMRVPMDPGWFERRLPIFQQYTLAAMVAQAERAFHWLIFYSTEYAEHMKPVLALLKSSGLKWHLVPVAEGTFWEFNAEMRAAMAKAIPADTTHVLSTRIDNDDSIADDFAALLQAAALKSIERDNPERVFLNFTVGRNLQDGKFIEHQHPHNMFLSVLERADNYQGIFTWAHNSAPKIAPMIQIAERDRWTHVIHGDNVWPPGRTL